MQLQEFGLLRSRKTAGCSMSACQLRRQQECAGENAWLIWDAL